MQRKSKEIGVAKKHFLILMRIGLGQIIVISLILVLLFGDLQNLKKKFLSFINKVKETFYQK